MMAVQRFGAMELRLQKRLEAVCTNGLVKDDTSYRVLLELQDLFTMGLVRLRNDYWYPTIEGQALYDEYVGNEPARQPAQTVANEGAGAETVADVAIDFAYGHVLQAYREDYELISAMLARVSGQVSVEDWRDANMALKRLFDQVEQSVVYEAQIASLQPARQPAQTAANEGAGDFLTMNDYYSAVAGEGVRSASQAVYEIIGERDAQIATLTRERDDLKAALRQALQAKAEGGA